MRDELIRERVVAGNRALVEAGLVVLTFGNASAVDRDAGLMAIKPSGLACDALGLDDVPLVDLASGNVVSGTRRPSSDTPTHLALYSAFKGIGGVVHAHSPYATAWAQTRRELPCLGTTHADHFRGAIPVTRHLTRDEIAGGYEECTGAVIIEALADCGLDPLEMPAALVASHGPFAWGADLEEAVENAIALEAIAASAYRSTVLDRNLQPIPEALLAKHFSRKHGAGAYYGQPSQ
jgi:L-ribulose-5-phosphate 4-epimerase